MKHQDIEVQKVMIPELRVTSYFDEDVYAQFKKTVGVLGVVEPIVVVKVGEEFHLVDGLHRLQEAAENKQESIPAVVMEGDEKDVFLTNLFLNVLRGKTKVGEVRTVVDALRKQYKIGPSQIASKTGLDQDYISDLVKISDLPPEVVQAFDDGRLAKGKAVALAKLPTPELQLGVFIRIDGTRLDVQDVEDIVRSILEEQGREPPPPTERQPRTEGVEYCYGCHAALKRGDLKLVLVCGNCEKLLTKAG